MVRLMPSPNINWYALPYEGKKSPSAYRQCPVCEKVVVSPLAMFKPHDFIRSMKMWIEGTLIQDAFPTSTAQEREQIQTGYCSKECWDSIFPEEEEEE